MNETNIRIEQGADGKFRVQQKVNKKIRYGFLWLKSKHEEVWEYFSYTYECGSTNDSSCEYRADYEFDTKEKAVQFVKDYREKNVFELKRQENPYTYV